jgi:thioredoxin-related protein
MILAFVSFFFMDCKVPEEINSPPRKVYKMEYEWPGPTLEKLEAELNIIQDLEEGIQQAKADNKPILLIFAAIGSVQCRKLEEEILQGEQLLSLMKDNFVNVWLWVDDKRGDWRKWSRLQFREFKGNYQPHIFVLDKNGDIIDGDIEYNRSGDILLPILLKYSKSQK